MAEVKKKTKAQDTLKIADFRVITEVWPNGTSKEVTQYRLAGTDDWFDIKKSNVKRKLQWN